MGGIHEGLKVRAFKLLQGSLRIIGGGGRVHAWEGGWGTGMLQFEIAFSLFYIWAS